MKEKYLEEDLELVDRVVWAENPEGYLITKPNEEYPFYTQKEELN